MIVELIRDEYRLRSLGSRPLAQGSGTFPACLSPGHPLCTWHCTHNFLLAGQPFLQPPPAGILGAGVQRGLLGRGFYQESLDSVRTECSFERHLMDEWTNTQTGPGPSPCGAGSTSCTSAKVTLKSPEESFSFPMCSQDVYLHRHRGQRTGHPSLSPSTAPAEPAQGSHSMLM